MNFKGIRAQFISYNYCKSVGGVTLLHGTLGKSQNRRRTAQEYPVLPIGVNETILQAGTVI